MKLSDLNRMFSVADRMHSAAQWLEGIKPGRQTIEEEVHIIDGIREECLELEQRIRKIYKSWAGN